MTYFEKTPESFKREDIPDYLEKPATTLEAWLEQSSNEDKS